MGPDLEYVQQLDQPARVVVGLRRLVRRSSASLTGLELIEPGVVSVPLWRPDPAQVGVPAEVTLSVVWDESPDSVCITASCW